MHNFRKQETFLSTQKLFSVIALFFAVRLNKAKLPDWVDWILTAFVVFHVLTHLILTVRIFYLLNLRIKSWRSRKLGENYEKNLTKKFIHTKTHDVCMYIVNVIFKLTTNNLIKFLHIFLNYFSH